MNDVTDIHMKKPKSQPLNSILIGWIGQTDLNAAAGDPKAGIDPIATTKRYDPRTLHDRESASFAVRY